MADNALGAFTSDKIFRDGEEDDLHTVVTAEPLQGYRFADTFTTNAGLESGVKTYIVMPPIICESRRFMRSFDD